MRVQKCTGSCEIKRRTGVFFTDFTISEEEQRIWYEKYLKDESQVMFTIVVNEKFAGGCGLYNIDRKMKTAEFGRILISENARGGTGQAVIESVIAVAREELGINRIYLEVKKIIVWQSGHIRRQDFHFETERMVWM